jgi:hypothetical protein
MNLPGQFILLALIFFGTSKPALGEINVCSNFFSDAKSRYGKYATPLAKDNSYLQRADSRSPYFHLSRSFQGQKTESSCSLASTTTIINAIQLSFGRPAKYTEEALLKMADSVNWSKAVSPQGSGLMLKDTHQEIDHLLKVLKFNNSYELTSAHMLGQEEEALFRQALHDMNQGKGFIIMNYDQGFLLSQRQSYGHYSPVGAFDEQTDRILILDTDAEFYGPYWVSVDMAIKSMRTMDTDAKKFRGFLMLQSITN